MTGVDAGMMIELPSDWKEGVDAIENTERIRILERLKDRPWNVSDLASELGVSPERIVHHINVLRRVKALQLEDKWEEKESFGKVYSVDKEVAEYLLETVRNLAKHLSQ